jgi:N-acetylneuraminic acid mutarotase
MHKARIGLGAATVNNKIYAIGGLGDVTGVGYTSLDINEEYNAVTDSWTYRTPMPTPRYGFAITVWQNKIYCIGGKPPNRQATPSLTATDVNEVYDPVTDTWTTLKPMPTPRMNLQANVVNGKIYLIGGRILDIPDSTTYNLNEVYDPLTDTWSTKASMPISAAICASAVVNNKIYVFAQGLNMIYDPQNDSWSYGASPLNNNIATAGATTGMFAPIRIYVFNDQKVQSYDPNR